MHSATVIILLGLSAIAFAQFGPRGPPKMPQSCKTDTENQKQCLETNVQAKGVSNVKIEDIHKCFESCPQPEHAKGGDFAKGGEFAKGAFPKGEFPFAKNGQASANGDAHAKVGPAAVGGHAAANASGNWAQFKDELQQFHECVDKQLGDKQQTCESGKITFALAQPIAKGEEGPRGGPMGFGNPLKMLAERVKQCPESESCLRTALGSWFDKTDELSQILCDASTACPHTMSDQCKSELKQINDARCSCNEQLRPDVEQAQKDCATSETSDALARMQQRAGGVIAKETSVGCNAEPKEHGDRPLPPSPFCPRPEESKGEFSKTRVAVNGQARMGVAVNNGGH